MQLIQLRRVSAKNNTNMPNSNTDVPPQRSRDNPIDHQQQRYGASAYIDQSEYDVYKQSTMNSSSQMIKHDGIGNRGIHSNYATDHNKNRNVQDMRDDDYTPTDTNDYPTGQQSYTKASSTTSYSGLYMNLLIKVVFLYSSVLGLLARSSSYNGLHGVPAQPRIISAKQRNVPGSSSLYQVNTHCTVFVV